MKSPRYIDSILKTPLLELPVRSTAIETKKGLVLISPGSKANREDLRALGPVTDLVGPNLYHCAGLPKALSIFPKARVWGVDGAQEKKPNIHFTDVLKESSWPHQEELALVVIDGQPNVNEAVFIHHESKTLITTDLCFNLQNTKGLGARILFGLFGTYHRFAVSRLSKLFIKDQTALERSLGRIFSYEFDKVVMAHGELVESGGKELLRKALAERGLHPRS
jgi:hypothetical protein